MPKRGRTPPDDFKLSAPVGRRPPTHFPQKRRRGSHITVTGAFPSTKSKWLNHFEGLRERDFLVLLEYDPDVVEVTPHPLTVSYSRAYRSRRYTPDVLVRYRAGPNGESKRRPELCEVKLRLQLRKHWVAMRPKFRAAQALCRERGWRFRLVTERTVRQPCVRTLHFLLGYRHLPENTSLAAAIRSALDSDTEIAVDDLIAKLSRQGFEATDALAETWRLLATGAISTDFDVPLTMASNLSGRPWTLSDILYRPWRIAANALGNGAIVQPHEWNMHPSNTQGIGPAGSDILVLETGRTYARTDAAGGYVLVQIEDPSRVTVREATTGVLEVIPTSVLRRLDFVENDGRSDLLALSPNEVEIASRRLESIQPFLGATRVKKQDAEAAAQPIGVTAKTWRGWLRSYQRNPVLASLLRKSRSDIGCGRFGDEGESLVSAHVELWRRNNALTIKEAHGELKDAVTRHNRSHPSRTLRAPHYITFYRRCIALAPFDVASGKKGKRIAKLNHGLVRGAFDSSNYPLAVVQIDHTPLPVQVIDGEFGIAVGTPWITVIIDLYSRVVLGFYLSLEAPGNLSTGLAITNAILPKSDWLARLGIKWDWPCCGIMRILHADNAGEFRGNVLELACKAYDIELHWRKVKQPNYGGHIEAYLGSLSEKLKAVPGATLEGPHKFGERNPTEEAVATIEDIEKWLLLLLYEYHFSEHSGLNGQSPIARWRDGMHGSLISPGVGRVRVPTDAGKLRVDFLPVTERTVGPMGILWDYIHYSHPVLQRWVNARDPDNRRLSRKFLCRRDPRDLSRIYFWDPERKEYFVIPYRNAVRPSITIWEHQAVRDFLRERGRSEIDEDMLFQAREERRRLLDESKRKADQVRRVRDQERKSRAQAGARRFQDEWEQRSEATAPPSESDQTGRSGTAEIAFDDIEAFEDLE